MQRYSRLPRVGSLSTFEIPVLAFFGFANWFEPDDEVSGDRLYKAELPTVYVGAYSDVPTLHEIDEQIHNLCDEYLPFDDAGKQARVTCSAGDSEYFAGQTLPNPQRISEYHITFHPCAQRWVIIHEFCHVLAIEMTGKGGHGSAFRKALGLVLNGEGRSNLMVELERKLMLPPHYVPLEIDNAMVGFIPIVEDAFKLHPGEGSWAETPVRAEIPHF